MHCEMRGLVGPTVSETNADPENGHESASFAAKTTSPSPATIVQLERSVSKPGFLTRLAGVGCGQVQVGPALQHRPPHEPVMHSAFPLQRAPALFLRVHVVPAQ